MLRFDKLAPNRYPQVRELMAKCKQYARQAKKHPSIFEATLSELRDKAPPRNIADRLFKSYLESFETVFRLHHITTLKHEYEEYWSDPISAKDGFIVKLLLVLALGTCFDDHDSAESFYQASMQWVVAAHAWANSPYNKRRSSLVEVQIHCLLLLNNFPFNFETPNSGALSNTLFSDPIYWPFQE
ncbi:Transcription factor [Botryosphaeria dothidea]|uniref:Transcription factor n=1 Tax=Botryosphaeria dothidea TaxID=55169 RepID=A0A8H4N1N0_9PEZI|nr:Transcription factor [Botryosphaeria dothidea]